MTEQTKPTDQVRVFHGDSREVLRTLPEASIDSVVCDPPYALTSIVKRFGAEGAAPAKSGKSGAFARSSRGFMGQKWDTGEVAFDPAFWAEVLRVLKPGGHLLAFGGSRTYGELQVAVMAAGFEVRDSILELIAADTGVIDFLNSLDDEQLRAFAKTFEDSQFGGLLAWVYGSGFPKSHDVSKAIAKAGAGQRGAARRKTAEQAQEWDGWGTALKPAFEPIIMARKPLSEGTVAANVLAHRTGALHIDACRVPGEKPDTTRGASTKASSMVGTLGAQGRIEDDGRGRWPANIITDGSARVVDAFPREAGAAAQVKGSEPSSVTSGIFGKFASRTEGSFFGDSGSAARFFYDAKADGDDRVKRCPVCSVRWIGKRPCACRDPETGKLSTPVGHPTVKPVDLMAYLSRLVTPPGGVVLDCFAGSGTTGMACLREGFRAILIEREAPYVADIMHRLRHVAGDDAPLFGGRT